MAYGVVKFYDNPGGFGVISFEDTEVIFHKDSILEGHELQEGVIVVFDLDHEQDGLAAINIRTK